MSRLAAFALFLSLAAAGCAHRGAAVCSRQTLNAYRCGPITLQQCADRKGGLSFQSVTPRGCRLERHCTCPATHRVAVNYFVSCNATGARYRCVKRCRCRLISDSDREAGPYIHYDFNRWRRAWD